MQPFDVAIIGGGIVGLATLYQLARRFPALRVVLLEKESSLAQHQSGHNSGVLHSGIYYRPGSLRAINCRAGKRAMEQFCAEQGLPFEICGKVIVAVDASELAALERIYERGRLNGVLCEVIDQRRLQELEPHVAGIRAIHVPEAGIVDYRAVCRRLGELATAAGASVRCGTAVIGMRRYARSVVVETNAGEVEAQFVLNCAGLYCDKVAAMSGLEPPVQVVPFRGEYFDLHPHAQHLCRNLIYPVPDPKFPFLGVHFTRTIAGGVECGPNAVLAFAREGYARTDIHWGELLETLTYSGFVRLALSHWREGLSELWRSWNRAAFLAALQRLVPAIRDEDISPAPAGVRAQSVTPAGSLVDDFLIRDDERVIHVLNAPSPAATSSLNVGQLVVDRLATRWT